MSHLTLDARAILAYLNELGYRNISAEQLREFMKDLRKLIKYEERLGTNAHKEDYFESLFQRTTASYRAKQDKENLSATKVQDKTEANMKKKKKFAIEATKSAELQQKRSAVEQKKSALEQKNSTLEQQNAVLEQNKPAVFQQIPTAEQRKSPLEQKKSTLEQKKSTLEPKKSTMEQKKSTTEQKKSSMQQQRDDLRSEQNNDRKKGNNDQVPPLALSTSPVRAGASYVVLPQRKVLGEAPSALNRQILKNPFNWFLTGEDDDEDIRKDKAKKQTRLIYEGQRGRRKGRSKSPKSTKENRLDGLKEPLWEGQSMSSHSRSHSAGRVIPPQPSAKALSTPGGNQKKRRSQSSDRPTECRTYTARSMGTMVPQPRFNRGYRSCVNDPVKLYHYYQQEWKYFEKQIPGILTRADVRWQIRQKLLDPQ